MKFLRFSIFALTILGLTTLFSCGGSDDPSNEEQLQATWTLSAATVDGTGLESPLRTGATLTLTVSSGGLSYGMSGFGGDVPTFNGNTAGVFELNTAATNATVDGGTSNSIVVNINQSPITGQENLVLTFGADIGKHGDVAKGKNTFSYTFTR